MPQPATEKGDDPELPCETGELSVCSHPARALNLLTSLGSSGLLLAGSHSPNLGIYRFHDERPSHQSPSRNIDLLF